MTQLTLELLPYTIIFLLIKLVVVSLVILSIYRFYKRFSNIDRNIEKLVKILEKQTNSQEKG